MPETNEVVTVSQYNDRLEKYKLFFYERNDIPYPLKDDLTKQDRIKGKAMSIMVHLRQVSVTLIVLLMR